MSVITLKDKTDFGSQFHDEGSNPKLSGSSAFRKFLEFLPRSINAASLTSLISKFESPSKESVSQQGDFNDLVQMLQETSDADLGKVTLNATAGASVKTIAESVYGPSDTPLTASEKKKALDIEARHCSYALIIPFNPETQSYDPVQLAQRDWKSNCWVIENDDGTTQRIDLETLSDQSQLVLMRKTVCSEIVSFSDPSEQLADRNPSGGYGVANSSRGSSSSAPFYQEAQFDGFCGKHSINNAMGSHVIGAKEMLDQQYFSQESNGKISTCSFRAHPEILHTKFDTASKRIDVTKDAQGTISEQLGKADRFTRADDNGHDGRGHVSAYRKDAETGEWWHIDSLGENNGRISQFVVNVNALPINSFLIVPMQEDEAFKDLFIAVDAFEETHRNPVAIKCEVSIEIDDSDDEGDSSSSSNASNESSSSISVSQSSGKLKEMGEKIRRLPNSNEKKQLQELYANFSETYRLKGASSKEEADQATTAFLSQCRGIMNRRLSPTMQKV